MNMKDGTFVELEFTGRITETGEIFDLTDEQLAKENKIYNPKTRYGPVTIIIGEKMILKSLEDAIKKMKPQEKKKITLSPEESFGKRNPDLMKVFSLAYFRNQKITPVVGQIITLGDNVSGKVLSVSAGRVRIDFNHPLAGRTLEYDLKLNKEITEPLDKIENIMNGSLGISKKDMTIQMTKEKATIELKNAEKIPNEIRTKIIESIKKHIKEIKDAEIIAPKTEVANTKK
ncbi:MAG: FKBP-type peptidyl-prolyl cis-trans isomerase [archaeon]